GKCFFCHILIHQYFLRINRIMRIVWLGSALKMKYRYSISTLPSALFCSDLDHFSGKHSFTVVYIVALLVQSVSCVAQCYQRLFVSVEQPSGKVVLLVGFLFPEQIVPDSLEHFSILKSSV